jgi:hypothetical protein
MTVECVPWLVEAASPLLSSIKSRGGALASPYSPPAPSSCHAAMPPPELLAVQSAAGRPRVDSLLVMPVGARWRHQEDHDAELKLRRRSLTLHRHQSTGARVKPRAGHLLRQPWAKIWPLLYISVCGEHISCIRSTSCQWRNQEIFKGGAWIKINT